MFSINALFCFPDTFPAGWLGGWVSGWVGWGLGGWVGSSQIKDYPSPAKARVGAELCNINQQRVLQMKGKLMEPATIEGDSMEKQR